MTGADSLSREQSKRRCRAGQDLFGLDDPAKQPGPSQRPARIRRTNVCRVTLLPNMARSVAPNDINSEFNLLNANLMVAAGCQSISSVQGQL